MAEKTSEKGIYKKGKDLYEVRASAGTGICRRQKSKLVEGGLRDAKKVRGELLTELDIGLSIEADKMTISKYLKHWIAYKKPNITHATYMNYNNYIKKWIEPYIGNITLKDLKVHMIKAWHIQARKDGATGRSIQASHKVLKQALKDAMVDELLLSNPCDLVKTPQSDTEERGYLEVRELQRMLSILDGIEDNAFTIGVRLGVAIGARRGEILGLQWRYVDLDNALIEIKFSLSQVDGAKRAGKKAKQLKEPKTKNSKRIVAIDADTLDHLKKWKISQAKQLAELGVQQKASTPVCCSMYKAKIDGEYKFVGEYIDPQNFGRDFAAFCDEHGFYSSTGKRLCFHELRHTQATLLINHGEDMVNVSKRLGHHSPSITMDMYTHTMPGKDRGCADLMGELTARTHDEQSENDETDAREE